jgi:glutamyl-tRNA reductase
MSEVRIAALALHQRSAPIDARERLLEIAGRWRGLSDRAVLATCHRVEVYLAGAAAEGANDLAGDLARDGIGDGLVELTGKDAVAHLFEVASGLDSAVQGESQIRGQVRAALASTPASLDPLLRRLLERALQLGRSLRGASGLATVTRSVGSLAVDEIVRVLPRPERSTVLIVGAGETGTLAVRALSRRVGRIVIANRDLGRAEALAQSVGADAIGLAEVAARIAAVDGLISAADTRGSILTEELLSSRLAHGPLALVDIAVPRSVGPAGRALRGLRYSSVDDLDGARALPGHEVERVRAACLAEADRFLLEAAGRAAAEAISQVRARADAVRVRQLERALRRLNHLTARDRRVVETLSARVVNALLHEPMVALKRDPTRGEQALALFGIERQPR